jgi:hypothetical protein
VEDAGTALTASEHRRPVPSFHRALTTVQRKFAIFSTESYFREAWDGLVAEFGERAEAVAQRLVVVTFKPEAIVGRRVRSCLAFLLARRFVPILHRVVRHSRRSMREIWRYQWNVATLDRLALSDRLNTATESLWVVLQDVAEPLELPAAVRLRGLKGSALPWLRGPEHLRSVLGGSNRMMTFVHASDEPIDVIREIGITFDRDERLRLYQDVAAGLFRDDTAGVLESAEELYRLHPGHPLELGRSLADLGRALRRRAAERPESRRVIERLERRLRSAESGEALPWREFEAGLREVGLPLDGWDLLVVGSHFVQHDVENAVCTIDEDGRAEWMRGEGEMRDLVGARGGAEA